MIPRPQFTLRALLAATLVVGAFFGGIHLGGYRERQRLEAKLAEKDDLISKYRTLADSLWKSVSPRMVIEEVEPLAGIDGSSWAEEK